MVDTLVALDAVTYASTEYLLQASCTFAQLAGNAPDLTLDAAGAVGSFLAAHVGSLLQSSQARAQQARTLTPRSSRTASRPVPCIQLSDLRQHQLPAAAADSQPCAWTRDHRRRGCYFSSLHGHARGATQAVLQGVIMPLPERNPFSCRASFRV